MDSYSDTKAKEVDSENARVRVRRFGKRIRQFFPVVFFGLCFLAVWMARALALKSALTFADLTVLLLATVATLLVLNQRLPFQNVVALALVIAIFSGTTMLAADALKVVIAPPAWNEKFHPLPAWSAPLLWTVALVNARGIAKLFLRALRKKSNYGIALIALSSLLVATLNLRAEFAPQLFAAQLALAFAVLVATTPWFIDKKRIENAPDFQPLLITILLLFW